MGFRNRDVFYDGCEKVVERTDSRVPDGAPRKCRVDPNWRYDGQIIGQCIFKEGIEPKYEDPHNEHGGHWMCVFLSGGDWMVSFRRRGP